MAPSSSSKKASRRLRMARQFSSFKETKVTSRKRRVEHDVIEGINIYSFDDELELEYFSNIEEPFPRKIKRFRGFDETDATVDIIKNRFQTFYKNFISTGDIDGDCFDNQLTSKAVQLREDDHEVEVSHAITADEETSTVVVSDDENSLNTTDDVPNFINTAPVGRKVDEKLVDVIIINDSDEDDDVVLLSDPKAPLPKPVRDCVCPNCGRFKRAESRSKRRITSESNRGTRPNDSSAVADEMLIITDEVVPVKPNEIAQTHSAATQHNRESNLPDNMVHSHGAIGHHTPHQKGISTSESHQQGVKSGVSVISEGVITIMNEDVQLEEALVTAKAVSVQPEDEPSQPGKLPAAEPSDPQTRISVTAAPENKSRSEELSFEVKGHSTPQNMKPVAAVSMAVSPLKTQPELLSVRLDEHHLPQSNKTVVPAPKDLSPLKSKWEGLSSEVKGHSTPLNMKPVAAVSVGMSTRKTQPELLSVQLEEQPSPQSNKTVGPASGDINPLKPRGEGLPSEVEGRPTPQNRKPVAAIPLDVSPQKSQREVLSAQLDEHALPKGNRKIALTPREFSTLKSQSAALPAHRNEPITMRKPLVPAPLKLQSEVSTTLPHGTSPANVQTAPPATGDVLPPKCGPEGMLAQTDGVSAGKIKTQAAPVSRKLSISAQVNSSFSSQSEPLSSCSSPVAPASEKPAVRQIQNQPNVPGTVRLVLPDSGKTVILKLDGAKSKMLPPSAKNPLMRTFRILVPQNELKERVSIPVQPDKDTVGGQTPIKARCPDKPDVALSRPQDPLTQLSQSQVKQQAVMTTDQISPVSPASNPDKVKLTFPHKTDDSVKIESSLGDVAVVAAENRTTEITKPLLVEPATLSVVRDLVEFVHRKETFPETFPLDEERSETPCLSVPCRELRCRLGCICISLAKKTVRRVRCKNANCIFGCNCMSHSGSHVASRYGKTARNVNIMGAPRRKQVLTVLPYSKSERSFDSGNATQTALKRFLPVQKMVGVSSTQPSERNSGFRKDATSQPDKALEQRLAAVPVRPAPKVLGTQKTISFSGAKPSCPVPTNGITAPVSQPRRYFGREKIPIPEKALMCLTPGLGYVPLVETSPRVTILNPFKPGSNKSFPHVREATEWLNSNLRTLFNTSDLRWVVADKSTLEKKQLHRLSVDTFKSPIC